MKSIDLFLILTCCVWNASASDFIRELPSKNLLEKINSERFNKYDAVVILKEQSYRVDPFVKYNGETIVSPSTTYTKVIISKLLNESAVKRYGSVEITYPVWSDLEPRNNAVIHARVLKPDGAIYVMTENNVKKIVSRESSSGTPLEGKVIVKIPNLTVGDVVQIESTINIFYARNYSRVFYYNERDPILFSNLYITLTLTELPTFFSFPEQDIGNPQINQLSDDFGTGTTYFWSLKNLNALPSEPYAPTFEDQSLITAFIVDKKASNGFIIKTDWDRITKKFYNDYVNQDNVSTSKISELGFAGDRSQVSIETADSLYRAIRKAFILDESSSIYPWSEDINKIFDRKRGDASDLSYIFYNILRRWNQNAQIVWIRDRRTGIYEQTVPTIYWFNRIGVLVNIGNKEKLYDFDRCIAEEYHIPWYLNGIKVVVIGENGCVHKQINSLEQISAGLIQEQHFFHFNTDLSIQDSMVYACTGAEAQQQRNSLYEADQDRIQSAMRTLATKFCMQTVDTMGNSPIIKEENIIFSFKGRSRSKAEQIDSFAVLKIQNHALQSFREKIYSPSRRNPLILDEPFTISMKWMIPVPPGYTPPKVRGEKIVTLKNGINGMVSQKILENELIIQAQVSFQQTNIPNSQFSAVIKFLDNLTAELESDIIFKKQ